MTEPLSSRGGIPFPCAAPPLGSGPRIGVRAKLRGDDVPGVVVLVAWYQPPAFASLRVPLLLRKKGRDGGAPLRIALVLGWLEGLAPPLRRVQLWVPVFAGLTYEEVDFGWNGAPLR